MNDYGLILPNGDEIILFDESYFCNGEEVTDEAKIYALEQMIDGLTGS